MYGQERDRAFANVAAVDGVRRLDVAQATSHRTKLAHWAERVKERFQLTLGDLYSFLHKLIELLEGYERKERYKLAEELKKDIFAWENLIILTTGKTREDVAEELGRANIYAKRAFRHLDIRSKEHAQIPHLRLLGWLLWAYSRCGVSTGVLIGLCAASLRGLATVSHQLWSLSG